MTEEELSALCAKEFENSGIPLVDIQKERIQALDYYNQEKFGNEEEGLSQFVTSDVRDTIEWIMPQLVDMFVGGDTPVIFSPENADDVEAADIESLYCQYAFERQNKGVILAAIWFKDALLQKNGVVKVYWDEPVKVEREEYKNKTGQEYLALKQDKEFEIEELTICVNDKEYDEKEYMQILQALPAEAANIEAEAYYNIVGHRSKKIGQVRIENVPPENFFVHKDHNSIFLGDAKYCCEQYEKTRSELIEMGYDKDLVDTLPIGNISTMTDERFARTKKEGSMPTASEAQGLDKSRDIITVYDHYIRADFNNDGVAELRHVRNVGYGGQHVLENEEVDRNIYHSLTPYINAYRYFGRSIAENLFDLQRAKSQLMRSIFDNVMYSTIPRKVVSGNVDMDALLSYVPGGIITKEANATIENETTPFVADAVFPILGNLDNIRAERTGFSKETMGLDPSALANATNPVGMAILSQSQLLIKMIATVFANSGFQSMMEHVRELVMKYEKQERIFDLTGKFLQTDPRSWRKQRSSCVKVGIGYAGKSEELATMKALLDTQQLFVTAQGGITGALTNPSGIYNTIKRMCQRLGIKDVSNYFQDPETYQPPQPTPSLAEVQVKANIENMNVQNKKQQADQVLTVQKAKMDHDFKLAELSQNERLTMKKIESDERLAEQELIYKYGKDSSDRSTALKQLPPPAPANPSPPPVTVVMTKDGLAEPMAAMDKKTATDKMVADQSMKSMHDKSILAQAQMTDKVVSAVDNLSKKLSPRKKKVDIMTDAKGNITGGTIE